MYGLQMITHDEARDILEEGPEVALFVMVRPGDGDPEGESQIVIDGLEGEEEGEPGQGLVSFPDWLAEEGVVNSQHVASAVRYHWELDRGHFGSPAPSPEELRTWWIAHIPSGVGTTSLRAHPVIPYALGLALFLKARADGTSIEEFVAWWDRTAEEAQVAVRLLGHNPWGSKRMTRPQRADKGLELYRETFEDAGGRR